LNLNAKRLKINNNHENLIVFLTKKLLCSTKLDWIELGQVDFVWHFEPFFLTIIVCIFTGITKILQNANLRLQQYTRDPYYGETR